MRTEQLISIILPVYNGMPHLIDSVHSIVQQSYKYWELIVVNDGSEDESAKYISEIVEFDSRIKCVTHSANLGVAAAYNTGLKHARSKVVAFQEQDDISVPHRLERQLAILKAFNVGFVSSRVGWMDANGSIYRYWPDDITKDIEVMLPGVELFERILENQTCFANTTTMLNCSILSESDIQFDERFKRSGQDWDFHLNIVRKHKTIRIKEPLVWLRRYSGHPSSTTLKTAIFKDNRVLLKKHAKIALISEKKGYLLSTFLKAWSNEFALEARYLRNANGFLLGFYAFLCWPINPMLWVSLKNIAKRYFKLGELNV